MNQIEATTAKIESALTKAGLYISELHFSGLSESRYITCFPLNDDDDDEQPSLKEHATIRISNHQLPDYHHRRIGHNIEVGENNMYVLCGHNEWYLAVVNVCDYYGIPYPPQVKTLLTKAARKKQLHDQEWQDHLEQLSQRRATAAQIAQDLIDNHPEIINQAKRIESLSGSKRRHVRSKFNHQWRDKCDPDVLRQVALNSRI